MSRSDPFEVVREEANQKERKRVLKIIDDFIKEGFIQQTENTLRLLRDKVKGKDV